MQTRYVRRGDTVNVGNDRYVIQRYGFEDVRQRYVTEDPGEGPVRVFSAVEFSSLGFQIAGGTNYGGRTIVPALQVAAPIGDPRQRILDISVFRVGRSIDTSTVTEFIGSGISALFTLVPFPTWGAVSMPILEPARPDPGHFVQYMFNRAGMGYNGSGSDVEQRREFFLSHHSIKVTFLGYK